jgi:hypothetical protein
MFKHAYTISQQSHKSAPTVWSTHVVTHTPTDTLIILSKFIIMLSFP